MSKRNIILKIENCMDCTHHIVMDDPDPDDWFCDDDRKVMCGLCKDHKPKLTERGYCCIGKPCITVACRPYQLREECNLKGWNLYEI